MRNLMTALPAMIAGTFEGCQSVGIDNIVGEAIADTERDDAGELLNELGNDDDNMRLLDQGPAGDWDGVSGDWDQVGAAIATLARAAGGARKVTKVEELPITETTLTAGENKPITIMPTRAMTVESAIFDDFVRDHGFIKIISIDVGGHNEINGSGGIFLTQHGSRNPLTLSGKKIVANQPINLTVVNTDTANSRKFRGYIKGRAV